MEINFESSDSYHVENFKIVDEDGTRNSLSKMTHFLVACDKCKGSLSAFEMCNLAESVLSERFPTSDVTKVPLTDGGEGFCEILTLGAQKVFYILLKFLILWVVNKRYSMEFVM